MEIRQIKHFVSAVKNRSILGAAKEQNLTQPAITRSIKKLELELGGKLLERSSYGVSMTRLGEVFYTRAINIVNETEQALADVREQSIGSAGVVKIGVCPGLDRNFVAPAIAQLFQRHDGLTAVVHTALIEELVPQLRGGELDFLFTMLPSYNEVNDLKKEVLLEIYSPLVCRANHPLALEKISRQGLSEADWAVVEQRHVVEYHKHFFLDHKLPLPRIRFLANDVSTMIAMIEKSDLIGLVPEYLIREELASGALVKMKYKFPILQGQIGLVFLPERSLSALVVAAAEQFRRIASAHGKEKKGGIDYIRVTS